LWISKITIVVVPQLLIFVLQDLIAALHEKDKEDHGEYWSDIVRILRKSRKQSSNEGSKKETRWPHALGGGTFLLAPCKTTSVWRRSST
jgi:hypothetical protein